MKRDVFRAPSSIIPSNRVVGVGRDEWKGTGRETKERNDGETKRAGDKVARDSSGFHRAKQISMPP